MTVELAPAPTPAADQAPDPDRVTHLVCPDLRGVVPVEALCGYVCSSRRPAGQLCVVCVDLAARPCDHCGQVHTIDWSEP